MMARAITRFGTIHLMVPNAGIERPAAVQEMSLEHGARCWTSI